MRNLLFVLVLLSTTYLFAVDDLAGNCLDFDGTDDYVEFDTGTSTLSGDFTVEAWAKPMHATSPCSIIGSRSPACCSFDIKFQYGNLIHGDIGDGSTWLDTSADATFNYTVGTWYHIAYVVTITGYEIYINGNLEGSGTFNGTPLLFDANHTLVIGNVAVGHIENFQGQIDDVRVWSVPRTQTEIQSNMNNVLLGSEPGLEGYWQFDELSGNIASDTASSNDGTLLNMDNADWIPSTIPLYTFAGSGT
jgi:hypothetical protein